MGIRLNFIQLKTTTEDNAENRLFLTRVSRTISRVIFFRLRPQCGVSGRMECESILTLLVDHSNQLLLLYVKLLFVLHYVLLKLNQLIYSSIYFPTYLFIC